MISISEKEIVKFLELRGEDQARLHREASEIRKNHVSDRIYIRGLIEFSNICINDCFYCGIRKSNNRVNRYELTADEIVASVDEAVSSGLASVVLQSGERRDSYFINYTAEIIRRIKEKYPEMGITLSCGEQEKNVYREFFNAGASRYLLRIETSDENHYKKLHPGSMSFKNRLRALENLKSTGFQVGTGVMINAPFQTHEMLARDILFFHSLDIDMCGMGPFIPHSCTPFGSAEFSSEENLNTGLNMIAVLRMVMPYINIASTTAIETLSPDGRKAGLMAGANVLMPQFSPSEHRDDYILYNNKYTGPQDSRDFIAALQKDITDLGLIPAPGETGTSIHFIRKKKNDSAC